MTAKITYKGQPDQDELTFRNICFRKDKEVEVTDPVTIAKLQNNPNFVVVVPDNGKPPEGGGAEVEFHPAPSTVSAQYPVAKPGEPVASPPAESLPEQPQPLKPIPKVAKK